MRPLKNVYPNWMAENERTVSLTTVTCRSKTLQISGVVFGLWARALCGPLGSGSSADLDANVPRRALMCVCGGIVGYACERLFI